MSYKEWISAIAILITIVGFFPYIRSIIRGVGKPHVFSWVIWGIATLVVFAAQLEDEGGAGAWPIGVSGAITLYVAMLAYLKRAEITVVRMDWMFLCLALASIPLWYVTSDPLIAVIIVSTMEVLGFGPTLRKSYSDPFGENLTFFILFFVRNVLAIVALENFSLTTLLFPVVASGACLVLLSVIITRRRMVS
ncbi:hypothetical protein G4V62_11670 [Bacillaceae bacterium SIJ1]|uniref:hypothetical protein n=1 Tax=Litoribacterium kuwaitense TaxID=1398745 RepID=UPI0013EE396A|nr:hypothetical protein [Litoribacterium kuwaitense]NGP45578.1 hypothetical protein [Litoribacterium kuwaitense]